MSTHNICFCLGRSDEHPQIGFNEEISKILIRIKYHLICTRAGTINRNIG